MKLKTSLFIKIWRADCCWVFLSLISYQCFTYSGNWKVIIPHHLSANNDRSNNLFHPGVFSQNFPRSHDSIIYFWIWLVSIDNPFKFDHFFRVKITRKSGDNVTKYFYQNLFQLPKGITRKIFYFHWI